VQSVAIVIGRCFVFGFKLSNLCYLVLSVAKLNIMSQSVWHIILDAELYTTCPGERVLVATRFNVTFLPLRLCYENTSTCFSKDAENLTTYGYVL